MPNQRYFEQVNVDWEMVKKFFHKNEISKVKYFSGTGFYEFTKNSIYRIFFFMCVCVCVRLCVCVQKLLDFK